VCVCVSWRYLSQHAKRIFFAALHCRCLTCRAVPYFCSHYLINGTMFDKNVIEHELCVLSFSVTFVWNISHSKNWARYDKKVYCSSYKVPVILIRFKWNLNFFDRFSKNTHIKFYENPSIGGSVTCRETDRQTDGRTEGHTDMTKLIVVFRNIANASKKEWEKPLQ